MINYFLCCIRQYANIEAECSKCEVVTNFAGILTIRTSEIRIIERQYQCQDCGDLIYSGSFQEDGITIGLEQRCDCGGQYRSDKNIFCPGCHHRKGELNRTEEYLTITQEESDKLHEQHGN